MEPRGPPDPKAMLARTRRKNFENGFFPFFACNPLKTHKTTKEKLGESKEILARSKKILAGSKEILGEKRKGSAEARGCRSEF